MSTEKLLFIGNLLQGPLPALHGRHLSPMSESDLLFSLYRQAREIKSSEAQLARGHSVNTQGSPVDVGFASG